MIVVSSLGVSARLSFLGDKYKCCASRDDFCQESDVWLHYMLWMVRCALGVLAAATLELVVRSISLSIFMCQSRAVRMHGKTDIIYLEPSLLRSSAWCVSMGGLH